MLNILKKYAITAVIFVIVTASCVELGGSGKTHELLNSVLWMQRSAEYKALTMQIYNSARQILDIALANPGWTAALEQTGSFKDLPPAVILDVDETVLDNSAYESFLIRTNSSFTNESWDKWCDEARAPAVPGAVEFCNYAAGKGVAVFYLTNRMDHHKEATRKNLRSLGLPLADNKEIILTRKDSGNKTARRKEIAREYRILLLIGDNNGDFAGGFTKASMFVRDSLVSKYQQYWGTKWIVLPNPAYGDWAAALIDYNYKLSPQDQLKIKYDLLRE